nr:ASCH domain-containing protein [Pseudomonas sp. Irchel s3f7]
MVRPSGARIASGEKTLEVRHWHPNLDPSEDLLIVENGRFLHIDGDGIAVAIVRVKAVRNELARCLENPGRFTRTAMAKCNDGRRAHLFFRGCGQNRCPQQ